MEISRIDKITQFKIIVNQLEICCNFITEKSITKSRIALILLDNVTEIILYRSCREPLELDDFLKWIIPQNFSTSRRIKISRYFEEKIKTIGKEKRIPRHISEVLIIGHKYRNYIYHRDIYNPATIGIIAKILFISVCDFFVKTEGGMGITAVGGHIESLEWLSAYNLKTAYIDFPKAAKIISENLRKKVQIDLLSSVSIFEHDLGNRIEDIRRMITDEIPWKEPKELNHILKWYEFRDKYPHLEDKLSDEYRKYIYKSAQKQYDDINSEHLRILEKKFIKEYHERISKYQQKISNSTINLIIKNKAKLITAKNLQGVLVKYFPLDELLSKLEHYINLAVLEWDRIVQREIDLRRGK